MASFKTIHGQVNASQVSSYMINLYVTIAYARNCLDHTIHTMELYAIRFEIHQGCTHMKFLVFYMPTCWTFKRGCV